MKRPYQITGIVLLLFACFIGLESWHLRFYTPMGPGNGFFPLCLSIFLAILAVFLFCQATFKQQKPLPDDFFTGWQVYRKMGAIALALIVAIVLLERLGFCLTMFCFYLFLLRVLGDQGWLLTIVIALLGSFGMYYIFAHWLSTYLPTGILSI